MITLGIETSCDETAAAVCKNGKILSSIVSQQVIHEQFGGVVPEIASREHDLLLNQVVDKSIEKANISVSDIDAIGVTNGPGLSGTLLTGISFAKGLGLGLKIPIVPINHLEGHIFANFLAQPNLSYPFICLLVSGGHTQLWQIKNINEYILLGETRDDAAGEAFDKGARILGLGYPGGPKIEIEAKKGDPHKIFFPRILLDKKSLDFSFSGLKTSLLYYFDRHKDKANTNISDIAASYQMAIVETLVEKVKRALKKTRYKRCVIAGGVAANTLLRKKIIKANPDTGFVFPDLSFCTDNAAMICYLAEIKLNSQTKGSYLDYSFGASPNLRL